MGRRRQGLATRCALLSALLVCAAGSANAGADRPGPHSKREVPSPLRIAVPRIAPSMMRGVGSVRVLITLRARPVLDAVQRGRSHAVINGRLSLGDHSALASRSSARALATRKVSARARALHMLAPQARRAQRLVLPVERAIARLHGHTLSFDPATSELVARVPRAALQALARRAEVASIARVPVRRPLSVRDAINATGAPSLWSAGFVGGTGSSDTVPATLWIDDLPLDLNHPDFRGVTWENLPTATAVQHCGSPSNDPGGDCDHGTQVASLAVGQGVAAASCPGALSCSASDAQQQGVAFGAAHVISSQDGQRPQGCSWGLQGFAFGIDQSGGPDCGSPLPGARWPAQVTNQSYGTTVPTTADLSADSANAAYGVLAVAAAGNEGPTASSVAAPCVGLDALCVGSYEMGAGLTDPSDDTISTFSARGPGPLGVKKPDLVASGDNAVADAYYLAHNRLWTGGTGTSFAAPLVAGAATLLAGSGITDHLAQKAILIDSARPGRAPGDAMGTQTGWQPDWGWGELDLQAALAQRANFASGSVPAGSARFFKASVNAGDRATLTWDMRINGWCNVANCSGQGAVTHTLTNLDLAQRDASTTTPTGPAAQSSTSTVDSVEQVRSPSAGQVVYVVRASSAVDGLDAEPFALAATSPLTEVKAPEPAITTTLSTTRAHRGDPIIVTAHLRNPSPALAGQGAQAELLMPPGVQLSSGSATKSVGTLAPSGPGDSADVSWTVTGTADGLANLQVVATAHAYGEDLRSQVSAGSVLIDSTPPSITLSAPSGTTQNQTLNVSWTGSDATSTVDHFDVDMAIDGGAFQPWLRSTTATAGAYTGAYGHSYVVRARAADSMMNVSPWVTSDPVALVDPYAPPGTSGGTCTCGGDTSTTSTTAWTPSYDTSTPGGGTTTANTRRSPVLRVTYAKARGGYALVRGTLRARGRVVATARVAGHSIRATAVVRSGRFALRLALHGSRSPRRGIVVKIRFAGDRTFAPAALARRIR